MLVIANYFLCNQDVKYLSL